MIHQDFGVAFEEDEAGYIAYHIVNAELNNDMINISNITKVMQQVLNVIKYYFKVEFNEEEINVLRKTLIATEEAVNVMLKNDVKDAMNKFNGFNACNEG